MIVLKYPIGQQMFASDHYPNISFVISTFPVELKANMLLHKINLWVSGKQEADCIRIWWLPGKQLTKSFCLKKP